MWLSIAAVAALSFGLRFWRLNQFNDLVFDEVYFARFGQLYLSGAPAFDAHPPLGKYLIAAGIWLSERNPWAAHTTDVLEQVPANYRWMNALIGSSIPLIVIAIARRLSKFSASTSASSSAHVFALLSGTFVAIDGLFIVESRYALINVYIVFFGLLAHWLWLTANCCNERQKSLLRLTSSITLGAAVATKWNGLGYILSLLAWEVWIKVKYGSSEHWRLFWIRKMLYLAVVPTCFYTLIWWPHLHLSGDAFFPLHQSLFSFHQQLDDIQSACSKWYTWPLLIKPISYWYVDNGETVQTVNNLGNPALWNLSFAAILISGAVQLLIRTKRTTDAISQYLLISYFANWVPWVLVQRCTYNYLFMPAAVFGFMMLALLMSQWLLQPGHKMSQVLTFVMLGAIALSFLFWLPLALGLPLTPDQLQLRWWRPSWI